MLRTYECYTALNFTVSISLVFLSFGFAGLPGKRRYILLIWRKHSDMVHYLKKSWVIILAIFTHPLYCLTFISIPVTFIQHKVASMIWITNA